VPELESKLFAEYAFVFMEENGIRVLLQKGGVCWLALEYWQFRHMLQERGEG